MSRVLLVYLFFSLSLSGYSQAFHWPASYAVDIPQPVYLKLKEQVQVKENWGVAPDMFTYLPVFNILHPKQRAFTDGIYYNKCSVHDSGRLFVYQNREVTFLRNTSTAAILTDYNAFIKAHSLPERKQVDYLNAIAAFMKFLHEE